MMNDVKKMYASIFGCILVLVSACVVNKEHLVIPILMVIIRMLAMFYQVLVERPKYSYFIEEVLHFLLYIVYPVVLICLAPKAILAHQIALALLLTGALVTSLNVLYYAISIVTSFGLITVIFIVTEPNKFQIGYAFLLMIEMSLPICLLILRLKSENDHAHLIQCLINEYVMHELANPLQTARAQLKLLKKRVGDRSELERLENSLHTIQDVISVFFKEAPNAPQIPVKELLVPIIQDFEDKCKIKIKIPRDSTIGINPLALQLVVKNLIKNAIENAGEDEADIHIIFKNLMNKDVLIIRDKGKGVSENSIYKIFKPNYSSKGANRGYGLTLSKYILSKYGAIIYCNSKVNRYTEFLIEYKKG